MWISQRGEVVQGLRGDGCSSSEAQLALVEAQSLLDGLQHQGVGTAVHEGRATPVAELRQAGVLRADALGPCAEALLDTCHGAADLHHFLLDLLPHTRDAWWWWWWRYWCVCVVCAWGGGGGGGINIRRAGKTSR